MKNVAVFVHKFRSVPSLVASERRRKAKWNEIVTKCGGCDGTTNNNGGVVGDKGTRRILMGIGAIHLALTVGDFRGNHLIRPAAV